MARDSGLKLHFTQPIINVHWGGDEVIVVFVDGPAFKTGPEPPSDYRRLCKTGPDDISGIVQGNGDLTCGNFLHEAGIVAGGPIDPTAEYLFYTAMYPGQASPQIREVWQRTFSTGGDTLPHATYEVLNNKVKFLERWSTQYPETFEFQCSAYKVGTGVGKFIKSIAPTASTESEQKINIDAVVFAIQKDDDSDMADDMAGSLQRAKDGIEKILPAQYGSGDPPADMAPSGLLWIVVEPNLNSDQVMTWKIRHGDHRPPSSESTDDPLPNAMTQCYPLGPAFLSGDDTRSGYFINAYRLDAEGTGIVYGKLQPDRSSQNIDPAWHQPIGGGAMGIPFQDPPPLINEDLV